MTLRIIEENNKFYPEYKIGFEWFRFGDCQKNAVFENIKDARAYLDETCREIIASACGQTKTGKVHNYP